MREADAARVPRRAREVHLDVRADIRCGREPFHRIMDVVETLRPGDRLVLLVPFEPTPLYHVLRRRGFSHTAETLENGAWRVVFDLPEAVAATKPPALVRRQAGVGRPPSHG